MKLYYAPAACSLSPHIVLQESGLPFTTEQVDLGAKTTAGGADYRTINPKGSVPALQLDDGEILTEGPAVVQYIADLVPARRLAPPAGTMPRYRVMEWLNFISTELHKGFGPLFDRNAAAEVKAAARDRLASRIDYVESRLRSYGFLTGEEFTVADAYLFTVMRWARHFEFGFDRWPRVEGYLQRVAQRPAVQAALVAEGLAPA
ncbi:MAG: glutathione transferase GstA [Burkholderiaceae bacterium]